MVQGSEDWHWKAHKRGGKASVCNGSGSQERSLVLPPFPPLPLSPLSQKMLEHIYFEGLSFSHH